MEPGSRSRRWLPVKPREQDRKLLALTPDECWPHSVNLEPCQHSPCRFRAALPRSDVSTESSTDQPDLAHRVRQSAVGFRELETPTAAAPSKSVTLAVGGSGARFHDLARL
jgi:hypothetical protein